LSLRRSSGGLDWPLESRPIAIREAHRDPRTLHWRARAWAWTKHSKRCGADGAGFPRAWFDACPGAAGRDARRAG